MVCIYSGGLDFSGPIDEYFYKSDKTTVVVDSVINLTGFALVGGPASQDHPKAVETLKRLDVSQSYNLEPNRTLPNQSHLTYPSSLFHLSNTALT